jgi:hypothetical protein
MLPPPNFPDVAHVANGCYISSLVYVSRFRAAYPAEKAGTAAVVLPNADGSRKPHTVAIVSWHGRWWARDEYYGLADLRLPSARPWDAVTVARRADDTYRDRATRMRAAGQPRREPDRVPAGDEAGRWRREQIETARRLLPMPGEIVWQRRGSEELPFLFFRTSEDGAFAVYDPVFGTAQAVAEVRDPHRLVAAVAERLGYPAAAPPREAPGPVAAGRSQEAPARDEPAREVADALRVPVPALNADG